jgi:hemolysin III
MIMNILLQTVIDAQDFIKDSGPLYHEFHAHDFIKEPWNAFSSLFFLVPVAFWIWRIHGQYRKYAMITALLPLLAMNGIGSTLYHAFRASDVALVLDSLPAMLMNLFLAWYMWNQVLKKAFLSGIMVIGFYAVAFTTMIMLQPYLNEMAGNLGYLMIGLSIIIPSIIFLFRTDFYRWYLLVGTFVLLGIALTFRSLDYPTPNPFPELLPMGTHFLWHITSALAVFTMGFYFKALRDREDLVPVKVRV